MVQSRRGAVQMLAAQAHPLVVAILRFIQLGVPLPPLKLTEQSIVPIYAKVSINFKKL
jgi:hypothetical protein